MAEAEKHILTYSNNHWAHVIRKYLGGDDVWREDAKKYAQLKDDEYDPDYMDYCYFSNRYMTQVMATLYNERERFPNVVECLLEAEPGNYYKMDLGQSYEIAQKYGSFEDSRGEKFNHCTAVIYTPNPCIVTVMTSNVTKYEWVIAELGDMLVDYTLQLDGQLDSHKQQLEEAAAAEELRRQEEELEAQRRLEEQQRLEAEQAAQRKEQEKKDAQAQKRKETTDKLLKGAGALVGAAVLVLAVTLLLKLRPQKRYDSRRPTGRQRYYEDEEPYDEPYEPYPESYDDREDEAPYEAYEDERGYEPRRPAPEYRERRPAPARERRQEREPRDRGGRRGSGKYTPKH